MTSRKRCSDLVSLGILASVEDGTYSRYQQVHEEAARTSCHGRRLATDPEVGASARHLAVGRPAEAGAQSGAVGTAMFHISLATLGVCRVVSI